jgi:hypothetical protein
MKRPSSWVRESLVCHPLASRKKIYVMLHAYMDASGSHAEAERCIVAGYWGGKSEWARFERAWNAVLDSEGVSEFHAKLFWQRQPITGRRFGEYAGWTDARHRAFVDQLLNTIQKHRVVPFGMAVDLAEWKKEPAYYRKIYSGFHQADEIKDSALHSVYLAFMCAAARVASYCNPGVKVNFYFDKDPHMARIAQCFQILKHDPIKNDPLMDAFGQLAFVDSKDAAPIQAADLLAYELHRYGKRKDQQAKPRMEMLRAMVRFKTIQDFWLFDNTRFTNFRAALEQSAIDVSQ